MQVLPPQAMNDKEFLLDELTKEFQGHRFLEFARELDDTYLKVPDEIRDRYAYSEGVKAMKAKAIELLKERFIMANATGEKRNERAPGQ